ncbi:MULTISPECIES: hypothetical protein [Chitinophaga]|nr:MULTISPECIES: hypothetical protein [Chitinophaga]
MVNKPRYAGRMSLGTAACHFPVLPSASRIYGFYPLKGSNYYQ